MRLWLERYLTRIWQGYSLAVIFLLPFSMLFCLLAMLRRIWYRHVSSRVYHARVPVIVVGNLSTGGTGKTPLVLYLIEQFQKRGYRPAVVSRGYRGTHPRLLAGQAVLVDVSRAVEQFGDEAFLIASKTAVPVVVAHSRIKAVQYLERHSSCDLIISDDGLQHYAMGRDVEICLLDTQRQLGNRLCLPAGPLRETAKRLHQVDIVICHQQVAQVSPMAGLALDIDCIPMWLSLIGLRELHGTASKALQELQGHMVHVVTGIGNPQRLFAQLQQMGIEVIPHIFIDHHRFRPEDFSFADDKMILMTEKDAVKCQHLKVDNAFVIEARPCVANELMTRLQQLVDSRCKSKAPAQADNAC